MPQDASGYCQPPWSCKSTSRPDILASSLACPVCTLSNTAAAVQAVQPGGLSGQRGQKGQRSPVQTTHSRRRCAVSFLQTASCMLSSGSANEAWGSCWQGSLKSAPAEMKPGAVRCARESAASMQFGHMLAVQRSSKPAGWALWPCANHLQVTVRLLCRMAGRRPARASRRRHLLGTRHALLCGVFVPRSPRLAACQAAALAKAHALRPGSKQLLTSHLCSLE